jgi:N-acetylglucosaminyldiphosphoundecaprenol N-acetyl-beta-D-mannosaminyltransferase
MNKYFNVLLEFDANKIRNKIEYNILHNKKGYVCVVDANVLTISKKDLSYRNIINNSIINTCDGSSIAFFAGLLHNNKFNTWSGPDIFTYYIKKNYKHLLLGSNNDIFNDIKCKLISNNINYDNIHFLPLPFKSVNDFDYFEIAHKVNEYKPDIIWVSLGAPKQEIFMSKLILLLNQGILFGIGAAFNFYTGKIKVPKLKIANLNFTWLIRLFFEPKKQITRIIPYLLLLPILIYNEYYFIKKKNNIPS